MSSCKIQFKKKTNKQKYCEMKKFDRLELETENAKKKDKDVKSIQFLY